MKLHPLVPTFILGLAVAAAQIAVLACSSTETEVARQFELYSQAVESHDLETLAELTADEVVWESGPFRFEGREEALRPNARVAGMETTMVFRDVTVHGNVVDCEIVERNEIIEAVGMKELRHFSRFVFENGLLTRKENTSREPPASYSFREFNRRLTPLRDWIRENHPVAASTLLDSNGWLIPTRENGARMLGFAREWVSHGAPGRLPSH